MRFFYFDPTVSTPTGKLSQQAGIDKYIPCFQKRCNLKNIEIYTPFVLRKQKVHIFHVYFQIATLKGTCVCIHIYTYMCIYIYIYIYYKLEEGAFLSKRFLLSDDFGFLVSSMLDN